MTTDNLPDLEHRTQVLQNWAVELRNLATAKKALHSVFTKTSEINLNDWNVVTLACIDMF